MGNSIYTPTLRDPLQMAAYYLLYIHDDAGAHEVSDWIVGEINIDEQEDFIKQAVFSLEGYPFVNAVKRFQSIEIFGGSQDPKNQRWLFKGVVKKIDAQFPETGVPVTVITAWGTALRSATSVQVLKYPDPANARKWAQGQTIKLSDIVKNILNDSFYQFQSEVDIKNDVTFTRRDPFNQRSTDWLALRELARISKCLLAETLADTNSSDHKILFVDRFTRMNAVPTDQKDFPITFRYLERDANSSYGFVTDQLQPGEISFDTVNFNMDVDFNTGSLRIVSDFNEKSSSNQVFVQHYNEETDTITNYELKSDSDIRNNHSSQEIDELWWKLFKSFDSVTFDDISTYFNKVDPSAVTPGYEQTDIGMTGAGPIGWVGYTVVGNIIGDVQIEPYRRYSVYGIGKFSSQADGKNKYYLKGLVNKLGPDGFLQELTLFR